MRDFRSWTFQSYLGHRLAEQIPVLGRVDRLARGRDHLDIEFFENPLPRKVQRAIEPGLAAHRRQQRIRPFLLDNAGKSRPVDRLDVGCIGHFRIGHDRRGVRIDQDDAVTLLAERLARLRPRVIEFTGLADDDRPCANNQDTLNVSPSGHRS